MYATGRLICFKVGQLSLKDTNVITKFVIEGWSMVGTHPRSFQTAAGPSRAEKGLGSVSGETDRRDRTRVSIEELKKLMKQPHFQGQEKALGKRLVEAKKNGKGVGGAKKTTITTVQLFAVNGEIQMNLRY